MALSGCLGDDGSEETSDPTPNRRGRRNELEPPEDAVEAGELFVVELAAGEFETVARRFRDDLREQVSTGQIEAIWLGYTAVGGSFQGIDGTEEIVQAGYDGVDLTLAFDRGTHGMRVLSDDQAEYAVVSAVVNDEYRPPEYADSDAFRVEETTVETEDCLMDAAVTVPTDTDADAAPTGSLP